MTDILKSQHNEDLPIVRVVNTDGEPVEVHGVYSLSIGEPHVNADGQVCPPIIILANGGDGTETQHMGVYFMLNDADNIRAIAKALLEAANHYETLAEGSLQ